MTGHKIEVVILGTAQDGGIPHAGCSCSNCTAAHNNSKLRRNPVSCGIRGIDNSFHLIEVGRNIAKQLKIWSETMELEDIIIPKTVSITHIHLGHVDGLGQFGKEVMDLTDIPLYGSSSSINTLKRRGLISPFNCIKVKSKKSFEPSSDCGFQLEFIKVPHRDEESDTHAIIIHGVEKSLLFLPDHDDWSETLGYHGCETIREWFNQLEIDYAVIDGTFWDDNELQGRKMTEVPHPTISETIRRLGKRRDDDVKISFFHLNHTNPVINKYSKENTILTELGWKVSKDGEVFTL